MKGFRGRFGLRPRGGASRNEEKSDENQERGRITSVNIIRPNVRV